MKVMRTEIPQVLLIEPVVYGDERGFFMETFNARIWREHTGFDVTFVQDNYSRSRRNVLRGLHHQIARPQGKLVRVLSGEVFDVAVDIRRGSPTFGSWTGHSLSAENKLMMWIPPGFAHGFCVMSETADFLYKCTDYYEPACERGIIWNDVDLRIPWPVSDPILSRKDSSFYSLAEQRQEDLPE